MYTNYQRKGAKTNHRNICDIFYNILHPVFNAQKLQGRTACPPRTHPGPAEAFFWVVPVFIHVITQLGV